MSNSLIDGINNIKLEKDTKIIPGNIKKDVQIFDIIGTYEGSGGSGDVKQFSSIEEMNNSTGNVEGDLAIVYASSIRNLEIDDEFNSVIFPDTVVLPGVPPVNVYARFTTVNPSSSARFQFSGTINATSASFTYRDMTHQQDQKQITYTTSDGLTYTRTDTLGNPLQLDTLFKHNPSYQFVPAFEGPFIQVSGYNFDGLFIYTDNHWQLVKTQLTAEAGYVYQKKFYGKNGAETGSLQNVTNLSTDDVTLRRTLRNLYSNMSVSNASNFFKSNTVITSFDPTTSVSDVVFENLTNTSRMFYSCSNLTSLLNMDTSNVINMSDMFYSCSNLTSIPNYNTSNVTNMYDMFTYCNNLTTIPNFDTSNVNSMSAMFTYCNKLTTVPNFNTINVTTMGGMFSYCVNLTTVPNFDTSNVTNMYVMFSACYNLQTVPNFDTSQVNYMSSMFINCINLVTVPEFNSNKVEHMENMFRFCNNLSSASIQNIINMCLNSNITNTTYKNLNNTNNYSPFYNTNITSSRYSNRLAELAAEGWAY